jgi:hypothetical protein
VLVFLVTIPMETRVPTPNVETFIPSGTGENVGINASDDYIEVMKTTYENEIARLHETYQ